MKSEKLQRLMNEFKEWDLVNDNEKLFHEDTVYEMLLHLQQAVVMQVPLLKSYLQILEEAAEKENIYGIVPELRFRLDEQAMDFIEKSTDIYASQSNSYKPVIGWPVSDVRSEGEQLGNEAGEKSVCGGPCSKGPCYIKSDKPNFCTMCNKWVTCVASAAAFY
jgi:hypothetical protein